MDLLNPAHVLVLDPDPSIRALLTAAVRRNALDVTACGDDESAGEHVRRGGYAAVILSADLRRLDSLLDELLFAQDGGKPKIILTTTSHAARRTAHADVVLWKPFRLEELQAAIVACCAPPAVLSG